MTEPSATGAAAAPASAAPGTAARGYRHLLVPFDGLPPAQRALDEAVALARDFGATIELLALFDPANHMSGFETPHYLLDEVLPRARARLSGVLESACERARRAGVAAEPRLLEADAPSIPDVVSQRVRESGADLVVVGTHGRQGIERFLLGSVAEAILRRSAVPVLLVHEACRAAPAAAEG